MPKIEIRKLEEDKTTIRIPKRISVLLDAYKVLNEPEKDKEIIIAEILDSHLTEFKKKIEGMRFK